MKKILPDRAAAKRSIVARQSTFFKLALTGCFIAYWLYARSLAQVVGPPERLANFWQALAPVFLMPTSMPGLLVFMTEMFHWRVLVHLIPVLVGWGMARRAAIDVMRVLYGLPDGKIAQQYFANTLHPSRTKEAVLEIKSQTFEEERPLHVRLSVGGPGWIKLGLSDLAVTEKNGRFHRMLATGKHFLESIEYIHTLIDLRPQERHSHDLIILTKDGLQIKADLRIAFRLQSGELTPSKTLPYPASDKAARLVAYSQTVQPDGRVSNWDEQPIKIVQREIKKIITRYTLDEILNPNRNANPQLVIQHELTRKVRIALAKSGIELLDLQIEKLTMPSDAMEQYIEHWQTHWESQIQISQAEGEAYMVEEIEIARAEAEVTMIQAIMEGVQRAQQAGNARHVQEIVALRLIEALEKMARQSEFDQPVPPQIMLELETLRQGIRPSHLLKNSEQ